MGCCAVGGKPPQVQTKGSVPAVPVKVRRQPHETGHPTIRESQSFTQARLWADNPPCEDHTTRCDTL